MRDVSEWQSESLWPWTKVTLIDGSTQRGGRLMRRRINGEWQYRLLTKREESDLFDIEAW